MGGENGAGTATLVVEDDEVVRSFLSRALQSVGLTVTALGTGAEALEAVRRGGWSLLFADGLLPDMHGLDLLREVAEQPQGDAICLCLLSGTVRRATAVHAGVSALAKPVRLADLADHVVAMRAWTGSPRADRLAAIDGLREEILVDSD